MNGIGDCLNNKIQDLSHCGLCRQQLLVAFVAQLLACCHQHHQLQGPHLDLVNKNLIKLRLLRTSRTPTVNSHKVSPRARFPFPTQNTRHLSLHELVAVLISLLSWVSFGVWPTLESLQPVQFFIERIGFSWSLLTAQQFSRKGREGASIVSVTFLISSRQQSRKSLSGVASASRWALCSLRGASTSGPNFAGSF